MTACSGVAFTGGFGTFLTALDHKSYELLGPDSVGNRPEDVYEPAMRRVSQRPDGTGRRQTRPSLCPC